MSKSGIVLLSRGSGKKVKGAGSPAARTGGLLGALSQGSGGCARGPERGGALPPARAIARAGPGAGAASKEGAKGGGSGPRKSLLRARARGGSGVAGRAGAGGKAGAGGRPRGTAVPFGELVASAAARRGAGGALGSAVPVARLDHYSDASPVVFSEDADGDPADPRDKHERESGLWEYQGRQVLGGVSGNQY